MNKYIQFIICTSVCKHLVARQTGNLEVSGWIPARILQHSFLDIYHEIFSTIIISLLLIQEGQLSVSSERMCISIVGWLTERTKPAQEKCGLVNWLAQYDLNFVNWAIKLQINHHLVLY